MNKIVAYFDELETAADRFRTSLINVEKQYTKHLSTLDHIINFEEKTEWSTFSDKEKILTKNTVLLVGLLYQMCKVQLVLKSENKNGLNHVNKDAVDKAVSDADKMMSKINQMA